MRARVMWAAFVVGVFLLPAVATAQGAIGGVVRDTSGAVLPGVTVEASSPALIERVRTAVTDDHGQYLIVDLRPGTYSVTFTLAGFSTLKREGLNLSAGVTLPINAELAVGALQETVTVTGETPTVDVQNTRQQTVLQREVLDAIPRTRGEMQTGSLLPGVVGPGATNMGGTGTIGLVGRLAVHGSDSDDHTWAVDGIKLSEGGAGQRQIVVGDAAAQEYVYETSGLSAENETGGVRMNLVPKEGGNEFRGTLFGNLTTQNMVADNLTDELVSRGLPKPTRVKRLWDISPAYGGPILRDRIWFFGSYRNNGSHQLPPGAFFESDPAREAVGEYRFWDANGRVTWQATPRNKTSFFYGHNGWDVPYSGLSATRSAEASTWQQTPDTYLMMAKWTSPVSNRLLLEGSWTYFHEVQLFVPSPASIPGAYSRTEITTGVVTGRTTNVPGGGAAGAARADGRAIFTTIAGSASYVTGSHAIKVGVTDLFGCRCNYFALAPPNLRFNNGVPFQVQLVSTPRTDLARVNHNLGIYAQDQWTVGRFTVNMGLRFDKLNGQLDAQSADAGLLGLPARSLDRITNVPNWMDLNPRLGLAWDVFGDGKTAVKMSMSRYVKFDQGRFASSVNPFNTPLTSTDLRSWTDRNGDRIPQADELGPSTNLVYGLARLSIRPDDEVRENRTYNWEYSLLVQRELLPALSATVGYFRRSYGDLTWTNNRLITPGDFTALPFVSPLNGERITAYNLNPPKRGQSDLVLEIAPDDSRVFDGVDITVSGRFGRGGMVTGGVSMGRTKTSFCTVWDPNRLRFCDTGPSFAATNQYKAIFSYPLPYGVRFSGTFQSVPGPQIQANYTVTSAIAGVPLTNTSIVVPLVDPNSDFGDRLNRLDVRVAKTFGRGDRTLEPYIDLLNVFNVAPVLSQNNTYGPQWQRPTSTLLGRTIQLGVQATF